MGIFPGVRPPQRTSSEPFSCSGRNCGGFSFWEAKVRLQQNDARSITFCIRLEILLLLRAAVWGIVEENA
jgi:hypothetical protein